MNLILVIALVQLAACTLFVAWGWRRRTLIERAEAARRKAAREQVAQAHRDRQAEATRRSA